MKSPIACLAEVGSIQIEFTRLSELTGDWQYHYVVCFFFSCYFKIRTKKKSSRDNACTTVISK
jgi:hypothetical protein